MKDPAGFLQQQQEKSSPEVAANWAELEELYTKRLWHQLTLKLLEFVKNPIFSKGDTLLQAYEQFISDFEHRINALSLMEMVIFIIKQIPEPKESLAFLEKIREKVKNYQQATILCLTTMANIHLQMTEMDQAKDLLATTREILDSIDGVTPVHGRFYDLCSEFARQKGDHAAYYTDALRYLGCTELSDISPQERVERAAMLSLAALLGDGVYNFGELLAHPILDSLKNTEQQWLIDTLYSFNSGNIKKWESLRPHWSKIPDLLANEVNLRQKIMLLCLMEMTFKRPAKNRQLTFKEIATETSLPSNEVEILVMKALSLGLVKGSIDQVEQTVHMTWVQPRVLDLQQIAMMQQRLEQWCADVSQMEGLLESNAHDILDKVY